MGKLYRITEINEEHWKENEDEIKTRTWRPAAEDDYLDGLGLIGIMLLLEVGPEPFPQDTSSEEGYFRGALVDADPDTCPFPTPFLFVDAAKYEEVAV